MKTRSSQRTVNGGGERDKVERTAGRNEDPLTRPSIRESRNSTTKAYNGNKTNSLNDKKTSDLLDSMTTKAGFSDKITIQKTSSKKKLNDPKTKMPAIPPKHDNFHNIDHHSDSEHNDEEESSNDEQEREFPSKIFTTLSKDFPRSRPIEVHSDHSQEEEDPPSLRNLRFRKAREELALKTKKTEVFPDRERREKENIEHTSQLRKAREKDRLLDTKKLEAAYSEDEEDKPKPQLERGNHTIPVFSLLALFVVLALVATFVWKKPASSEAENKLQVLTTFQDRFRKLQMVFTGQSPDLWQRSQRILELQLRNGNKNKEPAIILLTAAKDAEQMLHCVGDQLANIYATTLNSSYTGLSGLGMTSEDSEDVKMNIDQRLNAGFQSNVKAAVLHRIELLPPGSLLILYKYCDHENAAFKNIALVLTVLLNTYTLKQDIELKQLEETVHDFLKDKFINQVKSVPSHNQMDGDKLGGLWSRISHVVLPVLPGNSRVKECGASQFH